MSRMTSQPVRATDGIGIRRLLVAVSVLSSLKALLLVTVAFIPAWRDPLVGAWGTPNGAWLPLVVVSAVLLVASGEAARRRRPGAFWFVLAVNAVSAANSVRSLDNAISLASLALSALVVAALLAHATLARSAKPRVA